ncbi:MAG TPA: hypothetical protein VIF15_21730, partial [Polyangiaceae bacterium]
DASGRAFVGPGVDLVGDEAVAAFALAESIVAWLVAREPVRVRSLSFDVGRRRLLVTVEEPLRTRVVKIDPRVDAGASAELLALAGPLLRRLGEVAREKLAARAAREH